jgi:hypothetical protein
MKILTGGFLYLDSKISGLSVDVYGLLQWNNVNKPKPENLIADPWIYFGLIKKRKRMWICPIFKAKVFCRKSEPESESDSESESNTESESVTEGETERDLFWFWHERNKINRTELWIVNWWLTVNWTVIWLYCSLELFVELVHKEISPKHWQFLAAKSLKSQISTSKQPLIFIFDGKSFWTWTAFTIWMFLSS